MLGKNVLGPDGLSEGLATGDLYPPDNLSLPSISDLLANYLSMWRSYLSSTVSLEGSVEEFYAEFTEIIVVRLY